MAVFDLSLSRVLFDSTDSSSKSFCQVVSTNTPSTSFYSQHPAQCHGKSAHSDPPRRKHAALLERLACVLSTRTGQWRSLQARSTTTPQWCGEKRESGLLLRRDHQHSDMARPGQVKLRHSIPSLAIWQRDSDIFVVEYICFSLIDNFIIDVHVYVLLNVLLWQYRDGDAVMSSPKNSTSAPSPSDKFVRDRPETDIWVAILKLAGEGSTFALSPFLFN